MSGKGIPRMIKERGAFIGRLIPFVEEVVEEIGTDSELRGFGGFDFKIMAAAGKPGKDIQISYHRVIAPLLVLHFHYEVTPNDGQIVAIDANFDWQQALGRVMASKEKVVKKLLDTRSAEEKAKETKSRLAQKPKNPD